MSLVVHSSHRTCMFDVCFYIGLRDPVSGTAVLLSLSVVTV